jgi:hypothetical protein
VCERAALGVHDCDIILACNTLWVLQGFHSLVLQLQQAGGLRKHSHKRAVHGLPQSYVLATARNRCSCTRDVCQPWIHIRRSTTRVVPAARTHALQQAAPWWRTAGRC